MIFLSDRAARPISAHLALLLLAVGLLAAGCGGGGGGGPDGPPTTGTLVGTVRAAETTQPISGAVVSIPAEGLRDTTGVDGRYALAEVPEGVQSVTASASGYESLTLPDTVTAGQTDSLDFALALPSPTAGTLVGTVRAAETTQPISGAVVAIAAAGLQDTTGVDGRYTLAEVPAGAQSVTASASGYDPQTLAVTITAGETDTLDFALDLTFVPEPSQITFTAADGVLWRIAAEAGALPENVSSLLDGVATFPGAHEGPLSVSADGLWYCFRSERFDAEAQGAPALTLASADFASVEAVRTPSGLIHPIGPAQATSGATAIVYVDDDGPHARDLFVVEQVRVRRGTGARSARGLAVAAWSSPRLLTAGSPDQYNDRPVLSADGSKVIFHAGPGACGGDGTGIFEVNLDGTGLHNVVSAADVPPGYGSSPAVRRPSYAPDGSVVFESEWGGSPQIWRLPAGGGTAALVSATYLQDLSPTVLPDGRVASLWREAPGGGGNRHLKVMEPDGENGIVLTVGTAVGDIDELMGLGSGPAAP